MNWWIKKNLSTSKIHFLSNEFDGSKIVPFFAVRPIFLPFCLNKDRFQLLFHDFFPIWSSCLYPSSISLAYPTCWSLTAFLLSLSLYLYHSSLLLEFSVSGASFSAFKSDRSLSLSFHSQPMYASNVMIFLCLSLLSLLSLSLLSFSLSLFFLIATSLSLLSHWFCVSSWHLLLARWPKLKYHTLFNWYYTDKYR